MQVYPRFKCAPGVLRKLEQPKLVGQFGGGRSYSVGPGVLGNAENHSEPVRSRFFQRLPNIRFILKKKKTGSLSGTAGLHSSIQRMYSQFHSARSSHEYTFCSDLIPRSPRELINHESACPASLPRVSRFVSSIGTAEGYTVNARAPIMAEQFPLPSTIFISATLPRPVNYNWVYSGRAGECCTCERRTDLRTRGPGFPFGEKMKVVLLNVGAATMSETNARW